MKSCQNIPGALSDKLNPKRLCSVTVTVKSARLALVTNTDVFTSAALTLFSNRFYGQKHKSSVRGYWPLPKSK